MGFWVHHVLPGNISAEHCHPVQFVEFINHNLRKVLGCSLSIPRASKETNGLPLYARRVDVSSSRVDFLGQAQKDEGI